jgi:small subunit ribosomal protein S13
MICTNFLGYLVTRQDRFGPFLVKYFGIGAKSARLLCRASGLPYNTLIGPTPLHKVLYLENLVNSSYLKEFELRRIVSANLFFKYSSGSTAGLRLSQGLPSRFQRSKTNGQTAKKLKIDFSKIS